METKKRICHDLKTDRLDISPPLPNSARLLPALLYLTIIAVIGLNAYIYMQLKNKETAITDWKDKERGEVETKTTLVAQQEIVNNEARRADDVVKWVESAHPLQPLILTVTRSMEAKSTISELSFNRDAANPTQIRFSMKFQNGGTKQLDRTVESIQALGYRTFSAVQTGGVEDATMDYQCTLIRVDDRPGLAGN
jgi:hypothetical protein